MLSDVKNKCKMLIDERVKQKKKPLQLHENIMNGISNKNYDGDFYDINRKIIDLKNPLLTKECEKEMGDMIHAPLDPEGRSISNLYKIILDNKIEDLMGDTRFASFFAPFKKIEAQERKFFSDNV